MFNKLFIFRLKKKVISVAEGELVDLEKFQCQLEHGVIPKKGDFDISYVLVAGKLS